MNWTGCANCLLNLTNMADTRTDFAQLFEMSIGELFLPNESCEVRRVPGGWVWTEKVHHPTQTERTSIQYLPPVFIPLAEIPTP